MAISLAKTAIQIAWNFITHALWEIKKKSRKELEKLYQLDNRAVRVLETDEPKKSERSLRSDWGRVELNSLSLQR